MKSSFCGKHAGAKRRFATEVELIFCMRLNHVRAKTLFAVHTQIERHSARDVIAPKFLDIGAEPRTKIRRCAFQFGMQIDGATPTGIVSANNLGDRVYLRLFPGQLKMERSFR